MIRWIFPNRLATGPALEADLPNAHRLDVRNLVDAAGNCETAVASCIRKAVEALNAGRTVLIVCDFGVSRSNAVAIGVLARWRGLTFSEAVDEVISSTGESEIKLDMLATVRAALSIENDETPRHTVVTGASGFIGRRLCAEARGAVVAMPGRAELDLNDAPARIAARLQDAGASCIVHLAHPRIYTNNSALASALHMQKNLMDAALYIGARFILASCGSVFSGSDAHGPIPVHAPPRPSGVLGITKVLQENLLAMTVKDRGLKACIVRLSPTYGPGGLRPRLIQSFAEAVVAGRPVVTHRFENGPAQLELLHVADAAKGLRLIAGSSLEGIFHLGSGTCLTPADIAKQIADYLGYPVRLEELFVRGQADRILLESSATWDELGWAPRIGFAEGLAETLDALPVSRRSASS